MLLVAQKRLVRVLIIRVTSAAYVPLTRAMVAMMTDVNMLVDLIRKSKFWYITLVNRVDMVGT